MLYVQLDTNWINNPKVIRAGWDGAGLHAFCLCLAKTLETDGWIADVVLARAGASDELVERLVGLGLLERDGDRVRPSDWLERNPSKAAIAAKREAKKRGAKEGNHTRWNHAGPVDDCPICYPKEQVVASSDTDRSHSDRLPSPESESKPATSEAISDAIDDTAERRQQRIKEAARVLAEERAVGRDVGEGWIVAAARGMAKDHHQKLDAYLIEHPTATTSELVELMDAKPVAPPKPGGVISTPEGSFLPGSGWCPRLDRAEGVA